MTITADALDKRIVEELTAKQKDIELKGFRKGKVPISVLKQRFFNSMLAETSQTMMQEEIEAHLTAAKEKPINTPDIQFKSENWRVGEDMVFDVSYEIIPEIPKVDLSKLTLERPVVKVDDEGVEKQLKSIAEINPSYEAAEKGSTAEKGSQIVLNFKCTVDGVAFEGGTADNYLLVLGSESFIPGFEDQLIGTKKGDKKSVKVNFPQDYVQKDLAGKAAEFACEIVEINQPIPAELDDDFAIKMGKKNMTLFRSEVRSQMAERYKQQSRMIVKRYLMDALDKELSFDLPPKMLAIEAKNIAQSLEKEKNRDNEVQDHGDCKITDEHTELAKRRIRIALYLGQVGEENNISVTEAELKRALSTSQARQHPDYESEYVKLIRMQIFEEKAVDYVLERVKINDTEVSQQQLYETVDMLFKEDEAL